MLFNGWLDNQDEIARLLGTGRDISPEHLYGLAVEKWGDGAEDRVVGNYCAIVINDQTNCLRLSRSAIAAPPLHFAQFSHGVAAASVPRVLVALGLPRQLNRRKLADSLYLNPAGDEGFLKGCFRVGAGEIVRLSRIASEKIKTFDPLAERSRFEGSFEEAVSRVDELLEDAARASLAGSRKPGILLSGGLDSSNMAARAMRVFPGTDPVPSFTLVPISAATQSQTTSEMIDERALVEAFCAMHPRIEPHFSDTANYDYDTDLDALIARMDGVPVGLSTNAAFRCLMAMARDEGCDCVLSAEMGNGTFSLNGDWAITEMFWTGRWIELYRSISNFRTSLAGILRTIVARGMLPVLPTPVWNALRMMRGKPLNPRNETVALVPRQVLQSMHVRRRAAAYDRLIGRPSVGSRRQMLRRIFAAGDGDIGDMDQGFHQQYGIRNRDVATYRPLVEFCLSLPTDAFYSGGEARRLARELSRGIMPDVQRFSTVYGFQAGDWHFRYTPRVPEFRRILAQAGSISAVRDNIDIDRAIALLDDWPTEIDTGITGYMRYATPILRALTAIRFIEILNEGGPKRSLPAEPVS